MSSTLRTEEEAIRESFLQWCNGEYLDDYDKYERDAFNVLARGGDVEQWLSLRDKYRREIGWFSNAAMPLIAKEELKRLRRVESGDAITDLNIEIMTRIVVGNIDAALRARKQLLALSFENALLKINEDGFGTSITEPYYDYGQNRWVEKQFGLDEEEKQKLEEIDKKYLQAIHDFDAEKVEELGE